MVGENIQAHPTGIGNENPGRASKKQTFAFRPPDRRQKPNDRRGGRVGRRNLLTTPGFIQ
ncbi:hypothetical protein FRUB_05573 [Fimbriiglobus ruber]|uniref:Uncharacterized protein n=1 Tax=Fimbriiglobus ruber TaxID=1908690 RepID=A0A225DFC1_9BACT|nr:hypothetical protein FRUB_05573 [Fimbriiglobus ruber]